MRDSRQDRVDQPDAHERHDAGEGDGENRLRLPEGAGYSPAHQCSVRTADPVLSAGLSCSSRCSLTSAFMAGSAAASAS